MDVGISKTRTLTVQPDQTIGFMGEDCRVYSTPSLIADIEYTCRDLLLEHIENSQDSVGTKVSILHTAPTLSGMEVTITVTVTKVDRARVVFDVSASDPLDAICRGTHERFVVGVEETKKRLVAKAAKAANQT